MAPEAIVSSAGSMSTWYCLHATEKVDVGGRLYPVNVYVPVLPSLCVDWDSIYKDLFHSEKPIGKDRAALSRMSWEETFTKVFQMFSTLLPQAHWILLEDDHESHPLCSLPPHIEFAKVMYECHGCGRGWTSQKGVVKLWIGWSHVEARGVVVMKQLGQRCISCPSPFAHKGFWYTDQILRVLGNVFIRAAAEYLGVIVNEMPGGRTLTPGTRKRHVSEGCIACAEGVCTAYKG